MLVLMAIETVSAGRRRAATKKPSVPILQGWKQTVVAESRQSRLARFGRAAKECFRGSARSAGFQLLIISARHDRQLPPSDRQSVRE